MATQEDLTAATGVGEPGTGWSWTSHAGRPGGGPETPTSPPALTRAEVMPWEAMTLRASS